MHDARIDALARQLVRYSTALKKGEKVLIDLHDVPDSIGLALIREARAKGVTRLFALGEPTRLAAAAFGSGAECHGTRESLQAALAGALQAAAGSPVTVYVKGSRMNRLEKVVNAVLAPVLGGDADAA